MEPKQKKEIVIIMIAILGAAAAGIIYMNFKASQNWEIASEPKPKKPCGCRDAHPAGSAFTLIETMEEKINGDTTDNPTSEDEADGVEASDDGGRPSDLEEKD